jgi:hypothetical protein
MAVGHAGSWFNLPDYGITEKIGSLFGNNNRTAQGGSNLLGGNRAQTVSQPQGQVQGSSTQIPDFGQNAVVNMNQNQPKNNFVNPFTVNTGSTNPTPPPPQPEASPVVDTFRQQDSDIQGRFSDFINQLGGQRGELEGMARGQADSMKGGINASLNTALTRFPQYQEQVNQNSDLALRDLAQRGQQYQMSANQRLGLSGAGDSSGADMYKYALGKAQSRNEAGVYRDRNSQLNEIAMVEEETRRKAEEEISGVDQWLNSQVQTIAQQIQGMQNNLRGQSIDTRRQAYDQYMSYLSGLEQQANQYKMQLQQGIQQRMQDLNNAKLQIANSANFDPRQIALSEVNAMPQMQQQQQMQFINPFNLREEDKRLFS